MRAILRRNSKVNRSDSELHKGLGKKSSFIDIPDDAPSSKRISYFIWNTLEHASSSRFAFIWMIVLILVIITSCVSFIAETVPSLCCGRADGIWHTIDIACVSIFTIEYGLRMITCPDMYIQYLPAPRLFGYTNIVTADDFEEEGNDTSNVWLTKLLARIAFLLKPANMIDLLSILPFYLKLVAGSRKSAAIQVIKIGRVFRLLRIIKYSSGSELLARTIVTSLEPLGMLVFFVSIAVTLFSSAMYYAERGVWCDQYNNMCGGSAQDGKGWYAIPHTYDGATFSQGCQGHSWCRDKSQFNSIFISGYWCLTTVTTTGYGDIYPSSFGGKLLGYFIMFTGPIILALPITVISTTFAEAYEDEEFKNLSKTGLNIQGEQLKKRVSRESVFPRNSFMQGAGDDNFVTDFLPDRTLSDNGAFIKDPKDDLLRSPSQGSDSTLSAPESRNSMDLYSNSTPVIQPVDFLPLMNSNNSNGFLPVIAETNGAGLGLPSSTASSESPGSTRLERQVSVELSGGGGNFQLTRELKKLLLAHRRQMMEEVSNLLRNKTALIIDEVLLELEREGDQSAGPVLR
mmetsp:Transcript_6647/g.15251  ORF Transcript_6647/g.15251 Transcript_6647/m.15251 type:complete len:571 (-) Transcript_6647:82-1794(-)